MSAHETLIKNLENQLTRLVEQSSDLEECRDDLNDEEYQSMKQETVDQIKEFRLALDRLNKGDVTLDSKISSMRSTIRNAIASSFNTAEMIQIFGDQSLDEFASQLLSLEENFKLKKMSIEDYESKKLAILSNLAQDGFDLSLADKAFLETKSDADIMNGMRRLEDDD